MYRNPSEPVSESAVSPWMASILMRRGGAWQRFALYYRQLSAMPRRWRRQLRRKAAVGLGSAALVLALAGPIVAAPARQPAAPQATIVVVNGEVANVNNNKCGLIEAIINARAANTGAMRPDCTSGNINGPDTVSLPAGGNFVLTAAHNTQFGETGLPVITSAVTIDGHGATIRRDTSAGVPFFRLFAVDTSGSLALQDLTLAGGHTGIQYVGGGAVLNNNVLTIEDSTLTDNTAYHGGAVYSSGGVTTITGSTVTGNSTSYLYGKGGGVCARGNLTISATTLTDNTAFSGGAVHISETATITGSTIADNVAWSHYYGGSGGGVYVGFQATAAIVDSTIAGNTSQAGSDESGWGGGVLVVGQATITGSVIAGNLAEQTIDGDSGAYVPGLGGGLSNWGATDIVNSTVSSNTAGHGGGLHNEAQLTVRSSAITGNISPGVFPDEPDYIGFLGLGGGLNNSGTAAIVNSTISGNTATHGGGLFNADQLTVTHSTITGNEALRIGSPDPENGGFSGLGGGVFGWGLHDSCSTSTLRGVILSGNMATDNGREAWLEAPTTGCTPTMVVNAINVFGRAGDDGLVGFTPGATDIVPTVGLAAILSPLANNGGPTMTHALPANSPALDRAPNASCTTAPVNGVDQRGQPRNQNAAGGVTNNECDAGSFERAGAPVAQLSFYLSATGNGTVGGVAFAPGDIIQFTPAGGWSMYFDASDVGITKNVTAFEIEGNGHILLSLAAPQNVPGVGNVAAQDVLRFTPTSTGNNTAGAFTKAFDGSDNLLSTAGEKIDALGLASNGRLALSTSGAAAVMRPDNSALKAQDEDVLGFNLGNGQWSEFFNGTAIPGLAAEDVNALWIDPATGDLYISIVGAFNLGGIAGDGRDIVKLTPSGAPGGYTPSLFWDGSAAGFPVAIDGLEMAP